jgi:hypothetical protein
VARLRTTNLRDVTEISFPSAESRR